MTPKEKLIRASEIPHKPLNAVAVYVIGNDVWICIGETPSVGNPEARKSNDQGINNARKKNFFEAAKDFSATTAAEPLVPGYVVNFQQALIGELMYRRLPSAPKKNGVYQLLGEGKPNDTSIPILGPYIEKDHYTRVDVFSKRFASIPGAQFVSKEATSRSWIKRFGGAFHVKVAEEVAKVVGLENIRGLEENHQPVGHQVNRVDIATRNHIAVECKQFILHVSPGQVKDWVLQASRRFEPDSNGYKYNRVLVVIPDGKDFQGIQSMVNKYINVRCSKLTGRISICALSGVSKTIEGPRKE